MKGYSHRASCDRRQQQGCVHRHWVRRRHYIAHSTQQTNQETVGASALPADPVLHDMRLVLVAPKTAANIGAAARAAANFEAPQLWVVAPRCDPHAEEAYKVACSAVLLDRMVVVETLQEALQDATGSIGFTRRAGATRLTHASISDMLNHFPSAIPHMTLAPSAIPHMTLAPSAIPHMTLAPSAIPHMTLASGTSSAVNSAGGYTTALVFGREESGLTEGELRLCSHACAIPTGRIQGSMNLSHALTVVLYELYQRRLAVNTWWQADDNTRVQAMSGSLSSTHPAAPTLASLSWVLPANSNGVGMGVSSSLQGSGEPARNEPQVATGSDGIDEALQPATAAELERLLSRVADIAQAVGMSGEESRGGGNQGKHGRRRLPLGHLRALLSRARPLQGEVRSLHGLTSKVMSALGIHDSSSKQSSGDPGP